LRKRLPKKAKDNKKEEVQRWLSTFTQLMVHKFDESRSKMP
jgi:hypothetical protein